MQMQEVEKMLDNQNNDVKQNHEPHFPEAHSHSDLIEEVKNQTSIPTWEEEVNNYFKL
jgi:hypothetical protein